MSIGSRSARFAQRGHRDHEHVHLGGQEFLVTAPGGPTTEELVAGRKSMRVMATKKRPRMRATDTRTWNLATVTTLPTSWGMLPTWAGLRVDACWSDASGTE